MVITTQRFLEAGLQRAAHLELPLCVGADPTELISPPQLVRLKRTHDLLVEC